MNEKNHENSLASSYWNSLFKGANYFGLDKEDLSRVLKINPEVLDKWNNHSDKIIPLEELESHGHKERVVQFVRMFNLLTTWYSRRETQVLWLKDSHDLFGKASPLDYMINGNNDEYLNNVVDYLERITSYH